MAKTVARRVERTLDEALTRKMERRDNVQYTPLDLPTVCERLEKFLSGEIDGAFAVRDLARLSGGASMEMYTFTLARGDNPAERMVLRMSPPCPVIQAHREREFQILRAVEGTLPVPRAHFVVQDLEPFGEPVLITSFNPGVAAPSTGGGKASGLSTAYGPLRKALAPQFVRHLAALHTLDWRQKGLSALDHPAEGTTDSAGWRVALWDRVWAEDTFEAHPTVALTSEWLWDRLPVTDKVSVVHGDYRNGNFLFDEDAAEITVILDWELGHLGDRHHDLAYAMLPGYGHFDDSGTYLCAGLIDGPGFIADYERLSGLSVDPARLRYYSVLNMYFAVVACYATASRVAAQKETHLDVMMNFVTGLAAFFVAELNKILRED
ncbi:MAG: phosphotransferase family protein [Acidimicrobiia bacterium]